MNWMVVAYVMGIPNLLFSAWGVWQVVKLVFAGEGVPQKTLWAILISLVITALSAGYIFS
jgi:hypothetical protein